MVQSRKLLVFAFWGLRKGLLATRGKWVVDFRDHELTGLHPDVCNLERIGIRIDNPTPLEPNEANY